MRDWYSFIFHFTNGRIYLDGCSKTSWEAFQVAHFKNIFIADVHLFAIRGPEILIIREMFSIKPFQVVLSWI